MPPHPFKTTYSRLSLTVMLIFPALVMPAHAQQENSRYLSVTAENDIYAPRGQDRHYTNGVRIAYGPGPSQTHPAWYSWFGKLIDHSRSDIDYELAFGQNIYTPEYYLASQPIPQDRPYAGWLYAELSAVLQQPGSSDLFTLNLGMVGPAALAEQTQKLIHNVIGDPEPAGWDNQLHNEPALQIRYQRNWFVRFDDTGALQMDMVPAVGISFGNVFTDAGAGVTFRIGSHLPAQDTPSRILPGLSGSPAYFPVHPDRFDWMLHAGTHGRTVLRNIFLDGNTFRNSLSVDKRAFVHDISVGVTMGFGQFTTPIFLSFSIVWRGREFDLQQGENSFGSALIGFQY